MMSASTANSAETVERKRKVGQQARFVMNVTPLHRRESRSE